MIIIGLDPRVKQLMVEAFESHPCRQCGEKARRYLRGRYYCFECYDLKTANSRRYHNIVNPYVIPTVSDHTPKNKYKQVQRNRF